MIDNIEIIKKLLTYEKEGDFYMLYIFKRKKDQPENEKDNHQSVRTIKTYSIESTEYLDKRYEEIKKLCEVFSARAYIHVQKQNHNDVSLDMLAILASRIKNGVINQKSLFDSVVGKIKTHEKRWIIDIDTKDQSQLKDVKEFIDKECRPYGPKIIETVPTKNGYHIITERFDVMTFKRKHPDVDIQKKNPTLLYHPDVLS